MALISWPKGEPSLIAEFAEQLRAAHGGLVRAAGEWSPPTLEPAGTWGRRVKRQPIKVRANVPLLKDGTHPFAEVVNQAATVERLLDAVDWVMTTEPGWDRVHGCHPTTSSGGHDLEVGDGHRVTAVFEVSDVAGRGNTNEKMVKDLQTLAACPASDIRKFVVASDTSGRWLEKMGTKGPAPKAVPKGLTLTRRSPLGEEESPMPTWIVEVCPGTT